LSSIIAVRPLQSRRLGKRRNIYVTNVPQYFGTETEVSVEMAKIAVENSLSQVKEELQNNGHQVVNLDQANVADCQCCVISGQDKNVMGMANAETKASVINAEGLSAREVVDQVNQRVNL
jgi:hypothetical protein